MGDSNEDEVLLFFKIERGDFGVFDELKADICEIDLLDLLEILDFSKDPMLKST